MPFRSSEYRVPADEIVEDEEGVARHGGVEFTGVAYEELPDGGVSEITFINGLQDGPATDRTASGRVLGVTRYRRGAPRGPSLESLEWYEDGKPRSQALYDHGILLTLTEWSEDGEVSRTYTLSDSDPLRETLELLRAGGGGARHG